MNRFRRPLVLATVATVLLGVADPADAQQPPAHAAEMEQAMNALTEAMAGAAKDALPVVDFRELKALLPEAPAGMKRTRVNAERTGFMAMMVAFAEASYDTGDGGAIELKISDIGGIAGFAAMAQAGWALAEIDRETETGFERTITHKGFKGHEQFDQADRSGSIEMLIANRFMIEINGRKTEMAGLRTLLNSLDLETLSQLKAPPPAADPAP